MRLRWMLGVSLAVAVVALAGSPPAGATPRVAAAAPTVGVGPGLAATGSTVAAAVRVGRVPPLSSAPAYAGDFPDPFVLRVGSTYWAYSTGSGGRNLQVMSSTNLANWSPPVDPLPVLPGWAAAGNTWAPGVIQIGATFVMYYTVRDAAAGRQCVSIATSATPGGRFSDSSAGPLICQLNLGGSIDPNPFVGPDGRLYLVWKSDNNAIGQTTELWSQALTADGRALSGQPSLLLTQSWAWQAPVIEGPAMLVRQGVDYLFYGAGNWDSSGAAVGYATCQSPLGPCTNASVFGPWLASHGAAIGPSGPAFFTSTTGAQLMAYHAWTGGVGYQNGGVRSLWIDLVTFSGGRPLPG